MPPKPIIKDYLCLGVLWVIHYIKALDELQVSEPVGQVESLFISHRGNFQLHQVNGLPGIVGKA